MSTDNLIIVTALAWFLVGYALGWGRTVRKLRDVESRLKVAQRIISGLSVPEKEASAPQHLWGLPIVESDLLDKGTLILGDFAKYDQRPRVTYVGGPWDGDSHSMSAPPIPMLPIHGHAGCYRLDAKANAYLWEPDT